MIKRAKTTVVWVKLLFHTSIKTIILQFTVGLHIFIIIILQNELYK